MAKSSPQYYVVSSLRCSKSAELTMCATWLLFGEHTAQEVLEVANLAETLKFTP
jgi:hypothetical protein